MRHVVLTCKNHSELRWSCKEIAFVDGIGYTGARNIFFNGIPSGKGMYSDGSGLDCTMWLLDRSQVQECTCPPTDLIRAPEDKLVTVQVRKDDKWVHVSQDEAAQIEANATQ